MKPSVFVLVTDFMDRRPRTQIEAVASTRETAMEVALPPEKRVLFEQVDPETWAADDGLWTYRIEEHDLL